MGHQICEQRQCLSLRSENSEGDSKNINEFSARTSKANKGKKGGKERQWKGKKKMVCKRRHLTFYSQSFFLYSIKKNMCQIKEIVEEAVENVTRHSSF